MLRQTVSTDVVTRQHIYLERICAGNPFETHPVLRTIFDPERSRHVEQDTLHDISLGVHDPHRNHIYLVRNDAGEVVGITGFFAPAPEDLAMLALRWHGIVPAYRNQGYSAAVFEAVAQHAVTMIPQAEYMVELVPMADAEKAEKLIAHFQRLGFVMDGQQRDARLFPVSAALPADSGNWQALRRPLEHLPELKLQQMANAANRVENG